MGNVNSTTNLNIKKVNFEDMQIARKNKNNTIIINTLPEDNQDCRIPGTINIHDEVQILNNLLNTDKGVQIVIYGLNNNDEKIFSKYQQLSGLGFTNVNLYIGGVFEWLLLQEIYGEEYFPTTIKEIDILKYR